MKLFMWSTLLIMLPTLAVSQSFTLHTSFTGVNAPAVAWGDYDNDGDLDLFISGFAGSSVYITKLYRNDAGAMVDSGVSLPILHSPTAQWGDYDGDGDLDLALTGKHQTDPVLHPFFLFKNTSGVLTEVATTIQGVEHGDLQWVDYDSDDDLDIMLVGNRNSGECVTRLYTNDNGSFVASNSTFPQLLEGSTSWADYDNDGDMDFALNGSGNNSIGVAKIYRNNGPAGFSDSGAVLPGCASNSVAWADYDSDGDQDLLVMGFQWSMIRGQDKLISSVFINNNGVFTDGNVGLAGHNRGTAQWGDIDGDGDLDILASGSKLTGEGSTTAYRNDNGIYTALALGLPGVSFSHTSLADFDNDSDLDILVTGFTGSTRVAQIYRNNSISTNTPPQAPANLSSTVLPDNAVQFNWSAGQDLETPSLGLTYNLRITRPAGGDSNLTNKSGSQNLTINNQFGSIGSRRSVTLYGFSKGEQINWDVQSVDNSYAASEYQTSPEIVTVPVSLSEFIVD